MQSHNGSDNVANTRIYGVQDTRDGSITLVESFDATRALAFVAKANYDVKPVSALTLGKMLAQGYVVQQAHKSQEV
jgi:hypothetical protein